jgi:hypothetical protein
LFELGKAERAGQLEGAVVPSRSAIYRCLVRVGLIDPQARRRGDEHWKRWERGTAMELWQMDVVGGFLLSDGRRAKALTGVDEHSRFCVSAHLRRLGSPIRTLPGCGGVPSGRAKVSSAATCKRDWVFHGPRRPPVRWWPGTAHRPRADDVPRTSREQFEPTMRPIFKDDEWLIIMVGAVLGAVVGELQVHALNVPFTGAH